MRALLAVVVAMLAGGPALGCACCADSGHRSLGTIAVDGYVADELGALRLGGPATLYLTPCGFECVRGLPGAEALTGAQLERDGSTLVFVLTGAGRDLGRIALPLPAEIERFAVDPAPSAEANPVTLYKEWRLASPVAGGTVELVLSGRGNHCDSAGDFTHWHLTVRGPDSDYAVFGPLAP